MSAIKPTAIQTLDPLSSTCASPNPSPSQEPATPLKLPIFEASQIPKCLSREGSFEILSILSNEKYDPVYNRFKLITFQLIREIHRVRSAVYYILEGYKETAIQYLRETEEAAKINPSEENRKSARKYARKAQEAIAASSISLHHILSFNTITNNFYSLLNEKKDDSIKLIHVWFCENCQSDPRFTKLQFESLYSNTPLDGCLSLADSYLTQAQSILSFRNQGEKDFQSLGEEKYLTSQGIYNTILQLFQANCLLLRYEQNKTTV
jgi:hypothetical protein